MTLTFIWLYLRLSSAQLGHSLTSPVYSRSTRRVSRHSLRLSHSRIVVSRINAFVPCFPLCHRFFLALLSHSDLRLPLECALATRPRMGYTNYDEILHFFLIFSEQVQYKWRVGTTGQHVRLTPIYTRLRFSSPRVNPSFLLSRSTPLSPRDHFIYVMRLSRP